MQKPDVIFLDAVGTIFGVSGSVGQQYAKIALEFNVIAEAASIDKAFFQSFKAAPRMAFPDVAAADIPKYEKQWWLEIALSTFGKLQLLDKFNDFAAFFDRLYDYFALPDPWFVYPDVPRALEYWRSQGIELGIISNFDSRLYQVLDSLALSQFFTSISISTEVGVAKPERQIFEHAMQKHNCQNTHTKTWHIGDSFSEDYQGAAASGITQPIWLNRHEERLVKEESVVAVSSLVHLLP